MDPNEKKVTKDMMILQHSSVRKSLHWHVIITLFNAKVQSYDIQYRSRATSHPLVLVGLLKA